MPAELDAATLDEIERLLAGERKDSLWCPKCGGIVKQDILREALRNAAPQLLAAARERDAYRRFFEAIGTVLGHQIERPAATTETLVTEAMLDWVKRVKDAEADRDALRATSAMQTAVNLELVEGVAKLHRDIDQARAERDALAARVKQLESIDIDALADECWFNADDDVKAIAGVLRKALAKMNEPAAGRAEAST